MNKICHQHTNTCLKVQSSSSLHDHIKRRFGTMQGQAGGKHRANSASMSSNIMFENTKMSCIYVEYEEIYIGNIGY